MWKVDAEAEELGSVGGGSVEEDDEDSFDEDAAAVSSHDEEGKFSISSKSTATSGIQSRVQNLELMRRVIR